MSDRDRPDEKPFDRFDVLKKREPKDVDKKREPKDVDKKREPKDKEDSD